MSTTVTPLAPNAYDRREEQNFREWVRRNLMQLGVAIENAQVAANAITENWAYENLPEFSDDTAAGVGGLLQGQFYRTATGQLMVKL